MNAVDENVITCLYCGAAVDTDAQGKPPLQCPQCGELLIIDAEEEDSQAHEEPEVAELEEIKIRRVVRERRALVRTRSYYLVILLACMLFSVQLVVRAVQAGSINQVIGYIAGATLLLLIARTMVGKFREISARINRSDLQEPTTPPDFTPLSDGSQHARNLEDLDF